MHDMPFIFHHWTWKRLLIFGLPFKWWKSPTFKWWKFCLLKHSNIDFLSCNCPGDLHWASTHPWSFLPLIFPHLPFSYWHSISFTYLILWCKVWKPTHYTLGNWNVICHFNLTMFSQSFQSHWHWHMICFIKFQQFSSMKNITMNNFSCLGFVGES